MSPCGYCREVAGVVVILVAGIVHGVMHICQVAARGDDSHLLGGSLLSLLHCCSVSAVGGVPLIDSRGCIEDRE